MRVLLIHGGPKKNGNTATLARDVLDGAVEGGASREEIFLPDKNIDYCRGCMRCLAEGSCVIDDDLPEIKERLKHADGVIISSPTYGGRPCARLLNLSDRLGMYAVYSSEFRNLYTVGVSTAGAVFAKKTARYLERRFIEALFGRVFHAGSIGIAVGRNLDGAGITDRPKDRENARMLGRRLSESIRNRRRFPFQKLGNRVISGLLLRRLMIRNVLTHRSDTMRGVFEYWVREGLISEVPLTSD